MAANLPELVFHPGSPFSAFRKTSWKATVQMTKALSSSADADFAKLILRSILRPSSAIEEGAWDVGSKNFIAKWEEK